MSARGKLETLSSCDGDGVASDLLRDIHRITGSTDRKLDSLIHSFDNLTRHTHHLEKLDAIATGIESMNSNLVGPATSKKQIPLGAHLMTVFLLSVVFIIVFAANIRSNVDISPTRVKIEGNQ